MRNLILSVSVAFGLTACGSKGGDALKKLEEFKNKVCECKDKDCAEKVTKEMAEWGEKNKDSMKDSAPDKEMLEKGAEITKQMTECMTKLMTK